MRPPLLPAILSLTLLSCAFPSEADLKEEFERFVSTRNQCTQATDCVLASAGCPLGCSVSVAATHKAEVESKARALIKSYEKGGRSCDYECVPQGPPICKAGRCAFNPEPFMGAGGGAGP